MIYYRRATVYLAMGKSKSALPDLDVVLSLKPDFNAVCCFSCSLNVMTINLSYGAVVPESTCSGIQPYWSSLSKVVFHTAAAHPVVLSVNSRPSLVSGRSLYVLEHFAR